jgi:hypothetical protein
VQRVAVTGDEDDRHLDPIDGDTLMQIETVEVWQTNVEDHATRGEDLWARKELLSDANVSGCQPSQRIKSSSDSRTETSSTTNTIGAAYAISNDRDSWPIAHVPIILYSA